jgi:hypothetical protein
MALLDAPIAFISLCTNMSKMVLEHVAWRLRSLPMEIGRGASAACTTIVHCERIADWLEDGTRAVQTLGARRGERGEPRILCRVQTERPPMRYRCEDGMTYARTS